MVRSCYIKHALGHMAHHALQEQPGRHPSSLLPKTTTTAALLINCGYAQLPS
jgi:hypothetical protein